MSEIVVLAPELQAALNRKQEEDILECKKSYLNMVQTMTALPEETLFRGAHKHAKEHLESGEDDVFGNPFLQALALKNVELAKVVQDMIDNKIFLD